MRASVHRRLAAAWAIAGLLAVACGRAEAPAAGLVEGAEGSAPASRLPQEGLVSWYGAGFHDRPTASGERFDAAAMTMAHPDLPFGTRVKVTNLRNGRSVVVRVNDRGPHVGRRIADLSRAAAEQIGMLGRGVTRARIEVVTSPK